MIQWDGNTAIYGDRCHCLWFVSQTFVSRILPPRKWAFVRFSLWNSKCAWNWNRCLLWHWHNTTDGNTWLTHLAFCKVVKLCLAGEKRQKFIKKRVLGSLFFSFHDNLFAWTGQYLRLVSIRKFTARNQGHPFLTFDHPHHYQMKQNWLQFVSFD